MQRHMPCSRGEAAFTSCLKYATRRVEKGLFSEDPQPPSAAPRVSQASPGQRRAAYQDVLLVAAPTASALLYVTQQLVLLHLVTALLPLVPQLLQQRPDFLPGGDACLPDVVAADGEGGHGPLLQVPQEAGLALVLQQLPDAGGGVGLPGLRANITQCHTLESMPTAPA